MNDGDEQDTNTFENTDVSQVADDSKPLRKRQAQRQLSTRDLSILRAYFKEPPTAAGLSGDRWSPARVAELLRSQFCLHYSPRHAVRLLRARGLTLVFKRAREPRLDCASVKQLRTYLQLPPRAVGLSGESWSRKRLVQLIEKKFQIRYSPQYIGRLAQPLNLNITFARRERRLTVDQARELREILSQPPAALGLNSTHWTRAQIATLISNRYGVKYHLHSIRRLLQRWQIPYDAGVRAPERLTPEQIEQLRLALNAPPRESGINGSIWSQQRVANFIEQRFDVRYRAHTLNRTLARLGLQPIYAAQRGGLPSLNTAQIELLRRALKTSPQAAGRNEARWTRRAVADFIRHNFGVTYADASVPRLLRRLNLKLSQCAPSAIDSCKDQPPAVAHRSRSEPAASAGTWDLSPLLSGSVLNR